MQMSITQPEPVVHLSDDEFRAVTGQAPCAVGLPNRAYTSNAFFAWERDNIFAPTWVSVANACQVENPGDVRPINFMGVPMVLVRNAAAEVNVFHNVCSHRGNELVSAACHVPGRLRCAYHSWTYDLDGKLQGTPHIGGTGVHEVDGFCKTGHGLRAVRSTQWMGLIFVNLSGDAPDFADFIAPLQARIDALANPDQFARLRPAASHGSMSIEFKGNWKLDIENNLEAYHLPWVHPDLNAISRLEDHFHYESNLFAGQCSRAYDHTRDVDLPFPEMAGWPAGVSEYPSLYPNTFLGLHCDHFWTRIVEPVDPGLTLDHTQLYYLGDAAHDESHQSSRARRMTAWNKVFSEDVGVVEGMQRGRHSRGFAGGVFTPVLDQPSRHFARWMANRLPHGF